MTLRLKTFSAIRWTASAALFKILIRVLQVAILARLLAKEDFGLMAMALVIIDFASIFSDLGLNSAFMHRRDVNDNERSSLFWANICSSVVFCIIAILAGVIFAYYVYNEARLIGVIIFTAPLFIINAFGVQIKTNSEKELNFKRITCIDLFTSLFGLTLSVVFAKLGWGVYALVASSAITAILCNVFYWLLLSYNWRPALRLKIYEVKKFIGFGGAVVVNNVVNQINLSLDILLGGKVLGASQLGLYSIPRNLVLQIQFTINPVITRVGFPLIAKIQDDLAKVKRTYLKTVATTSSITAPLYVGLAFFSQEVTHILLGKGWEQSGNLLRIIALWGGIRSLANPIGSLLLGLGRADLQLKWNLGMLVVTPPILFTGVYFFPQLGWCDETMGMVYAMLILVAVVYLPVWYFLVEPLCHATLWEYVVATLKPFGVSIVAVFPAYLVFSFLNFKTTGAFIACTTWAALNYILLSFKLNREWVDSMKELLKGSIPEQLVTR